MICPVNKIIEKDKTILLPRLYPGACKPAVKKGQTVYETDTIAHCEVSAGQRLIKISHILGVKGEDVAKYMTRKAGDRIYEGEIIAKKVSLGGLVKKEVKSPVDGLISEIDPRGDLIVKFLPKPVRLLSSAKGKVEDVLEDRIIISTLATKISGFLTKGKVREGFIRIVANPHDFILPSAIKSDDHGKILVGGALLERSSLEKAVTLGVSGIVVGGINLRDFKSLGSEGEDIGTSLLITEGFGNSPMSKDTWKVLKEREGRLAYISSDDKSLLIPESGTPKEAEKEEAVGWRELKINDKVKFYREEIGPLLGVVEELLGVQMLNSGILAEVAKIKLADGQQLLVPASNLEIID